MLAGRQFQGQMLFDGDLLLGQHMTISPYARRLRSPWHRPRGHTESSPPQLPRD
jgi:hypothetical protein